jgi:hypothetical protein
MTDAPDDTASDGVRTAEGGTPVSVDVSRDRPARVIWVVFLGGPVIWFTHFMLVYLVTEAGCSGDGRGFELFDPPVPAVTTLAATGVAAVGCLAFAAWAYRRWQTTRQGPAADQAAELSGPLPESDRDGSLDFGGLLLALFSFVSVLFVGLPALVFEC